jgi:hypothetical protein
MSLTEILVRPEVVHAFNQHIRLPAHYNSTAKSKSVVPCVNHQSYALVGTAFDYCLRFCVAAMNPSLFVDQTWIAEISLQILKESHAPPFGLSLKKVEKGVLRARELYQEFLDKRIFTRQLARASLFLAGLDAVYRRGIMALEIKYLNDPLDAETDDCLKLVRAIPREKFKAVELVSLNPSFGEASSLVGGADADLIIDDMLVDIKTTKYFSITPQMLHQMVGYRILHSICKEKDSIAYQHQITKCAIYFSRHGTLECFRYEELISTEGFEQLRDWFIDYVSDHGQEIDDICDALGESIFIGFKFF